MNAKNVILTVVGFGAGVVSGYFICTKRLNQQYRKDVEEVKDFYYNKLIEFGIQKPEADYETIDKEDLEEEYPQSDKVLGGQDLETKRPIVHYNKPPLQNFVDQYKKEEVENVEEDTEEDTDSVDTDSDYEAEIEARSDEFIKRKFENKRNHRPYVIDYNEYTDAPEEYEKLALYYYSEDRVLCEDDDTKIEDEEEIIGFDYEDVLDMQTTVWVRNDILNAVYEIHRIDESYQHTVEDVVETPREREFRIKGRYKHALDD